MGKEAKKRTAGTTSFTVTTDAGQSYAFDVTDTAPTVMPSRTKREAKVSATSTYAGAKEMPSTGKMVVEVFDRGDIAISDIDAWGDVTATLVLRNGKVFSINGGSTEPPELDATEGKYTITLEGDCQEDVYSMIATIPLAHPIKHIRGKETSEITHVVVKRRPTLDDLIALEPLTPRAQQRAALAALTDLPAPAVGKLDLTDFNVVWAVVGPFFEDDDASDASEDTPSS